MWAMSRRLWNRLVHALNGNGTPAGASGAGETAAGAGGEGAASTDSSSSALSPYELQRLKNIRENEARLHALGLHGSNSGRSLIEAGK